MPNVQQPEMRRSGETRLVQQTDGPPPDRGSRAGKEHRPVPPDQVSPYGPEAGKAADAEEPKGRPAEGD
ncbi:hypothetical protein [Micromonospora sp. CPCC 206061]|uniref:hypothetical protein n=1 Tax=Micromonospora sp. CPCC 206061 TaxID=3122410 RepID=UPI002FF0F085